MLLEPGNGQRVGRTFNRGKDRTGQRIYSRYTNDGSSCRVITVP